MSKSQNNSHERPKSVVWILWLALFVSILIYTAIGLLVQNSGTLPGPKDFPHVLTPVFTVISLIITAIVLGLAPRLFAKKTDYFTYCIIRWAMSESIAIYGLVMVFLGAVWTPYIFIIWSMVMLFLLMPTRADLERFQYKKGAKGITTNAPPPIG